jgi:hypothetical protein
MGVGLKKKEEEENGCFFNESPAPEGIMENIDLHISSVSFQFPCK